jgi:hypothetical protein
VEWQPVRRKLDDDQGEGMVDLASRSPAENDKIITEQARPLLGIRQTPPGLKGRESGPKIPSLKVSV